MDLIRSIIGEIVSNPIFKTMIALVIIDVGLGISIAIKTGTFDLISLGRFYQTKVVPYVFGYIVISMVMTLIVEDLTNGLPLMFKNLANGTIQSILLLAIFGSLVSSIGSKLSSLGVNVPERLLPKSNG